MLDLFVFKLTESSCQNNVCKVSWRPYVKSTSRHVPLSSTSEHPEFVHVSWPLSEMRRMHSLSEHRSDFLEFRDLKIARFEHFLMPHSILSACRMWRHTPCSQIAISALRNNSNECVNIGSKCNKSMKMRIVLPYHRSLAAFAGKHLSAAVQVCRRLLANKWPAARSLKVDIAWSNHYRPLNVHLR